MSLPFGLNLYDKAEYPKYSIELSFSGKDSNKELESFYNKMEELDDTIIDAGVKPMAWCSIPPKKATKDKIADKFTKQLKASIDKKTGEELTQYPKRLKVKVLTKMEFSIVNSMILKEI